MKKRPRQEIRSGNSARSGGRGVSLIELLIAMVIGIVVLGAMYGVFISQNKTFGNQEQIVEMQQNARAAMDMMVREIRMAGYNPTRNAAAGIVNATLNSITFTLDITDNAGTGPPDGDTSDSNEYITYSLYTADGIQKLGRKSTASAANQPVAEHVQSLKFTYLPNATLTEIRRIQIEITLRTAKPDPAYAANGGYRTYTLTTVVTPRNLAY